MAGLKLQPHQSATPPVLGTAGAPPGGRGAFVGKKPPPLRDRGASWLSWSRLLKSGLLFAWLAGLALYALQGDPLLSAAGGLSFLLSAILSFLLLLLMRLLWRANKAVCIILVILTGLSLPLGSLQALVLLGLAALLGMRKLFPLYLVLMLALTAGAVFWLPEQETEDPANTENVATGETLPFWAASLEKAKATFEQVRELNLPGPGRFDDPAETTPLTSPVESKVTVKTVIPINTELDTAWIEARKRIPILGVMEQNGRKVVLIDTELKRLGDVVDVRYERQTYRFRIKNVDLDFVELEPAGIIP